MIILANRSGLGLDPIVCRMDQALEIENYSLEFMPLVEVDVERFVGASKSIVQSTCL